MKRFIIITITFTVLLFNQIIAQNPFKKFGVEVGVITLSKGKYIEFIPYDSIQHIGSVVINIKTGHIIELINTDSIELGYNYRPDVASRWMSPDPLTEERNNWTPYNYCSNNPVNKIDPNGMVDGWIKDNEGNVFWDKKTNSPEEFKQNYVDKGEEGYSYVSDPENANDYNLPSGEGTLRLNWKEYPSNPGDLQAVSIDLEFIPNTEIDGSNSGWIQTLNSNAAVNINADNYDKESAYTEQLQQIVDDGSHSTDPTKSNYFTTTTKMGDDVGRIPLIKKNIDVNFNAETSFVNKGESKVSITWGFKIEPNSNFVPKAPRILKETSTFHNTAIKNLPKQ
jgi:hypothetical protein